MATTRKSSSRTSTSGFTAEERQAIKEYAAERRGAKKGADALAELEDKIAAMPDDDRALAEKIHALVTENAPQLSPRTWYGMPAYAGPDGVVIFFQPASKFKARYGTLGFNVSAQLDDGNMWPTSYAVTRITKAEEKRIAELVRQAAG